jgi:hypothetical protein
MKKYFFVLFFFFYFGLCVFAQETTQERPIDNRFYWGAGFSNILTTGNFGASLDFGFLLYRNQARGFNIRNAIMLDAGLLDHNGTENTTLSLSDKIIMENHNQLFRYYSFFQGGIVLYENDNKEVFQMPIGYNLGVGFGIDFFVEKNTSFFLDYTLLSNVLENTWKDSLYTKFTLGARQFF